MDRVTNNDLAGRGRWSLIATAGSGRRHHKRAILLLAAVII
jgi:hypothetical protein